MTSNTVTIPAQLVSGSTTTYYGGGTYYTTASAQYATPEQAWGAYVAFNYTIAGAIHTGWAADGYTTTTGDYTPTTPITSTSAGNNFVGQWVQIQCPSAFRLSGYSILMTSTTYINRGPKSFVLLGSNDGSTWSLLDSRSNVTSYQAGVAKPFGGINVTTPYKYYRFVMRKSNGYDAYVSAHGIILYEMP